MRLTEKEIKEKYPSAYIREGAYIGEGATIRQGAYIGEGATIREGADIGEGATIREGADIGQGAIIGPQRRFARCTRRNLKSVSLPTRRSPTTT